VRSAVVTGAAQGLGLALVQALAQRGTDVLMVDVTARSGSYPPQTAAAARRILRALDAGEYYVFTHVGSDDRIGPRVAEILEACRVTNELAPSSDQMAV
jgi:NAD(P)-dependent dehydrogenase (short-subunit alcohol dehydrogenase family)